MPSNPFDEIPDILTLEDRFDFIESENARQNITVCFQYVIFLTVIKEMYSRSGAIELSLYRDIVVHTASVVESCLHYGISKLLRDAHITKESFEKEWVIEKKHDIHTIADDEKIIWAHKKRRVKTLNNNPMSKDINKAAKSVKLIDQTLYEKAEKIREMRNNIHVNGENKTVIYPSKDDITAVFEDSKVLLDRIRDVLQDPSKLLNV